MLEKIDIALASDQKYFPGLLVTAYSSAKYAAEEVFLCFNILDSGLSDQSYDILCDSVKRVHPRSEIRRFKINEEDFAKFPDWRGNKMAYVRFLLPELLPESDFVFYTDVDCLWFADVAEIWTKRNPEFAIKGVWDSYAENDDSNWFQSKGLVYKSGKYFCTGNILMNLKLIRERNIIEKTIDFILKYPDVHYPDQTSLNYVVQDSVELLPSYCNYFTLSIDREDVRKPVILHFANDFPWLFAERCDGVPPPYMMWWYQCYAEATGKSVKETLRIFKVSGMEFFLKYGWMLKYKVFRYPFFMFLVVCGKRKWIPSFHRYCGKEIRLI